MTRLNRDFYDRPALEVARALLGCRLVREQSGQHLTGLILETEAYQGEQDLGCHASAGKTPRTAVMYGPPGHAYVYFTYGMHWLFNVVTDRVDTPSAVLIRKIQPIEGLDIMAENRPYKAGKSGWTDGPAKLTQALAVDEQFNGVDLCNPDFQKLAAAYGIPSVRVDDLDSFSAALAKGIGSQELNLIELTVELQDPPPATLT